MSKRKLLNLVKGVQIKQSLQLSLKMRLFLKREMEHLHWNLMLGKLGEGRKPPRALWKEAGTNQLLHLSSSMTHRLQPV